MYLTALLSLFPIYLLFPPSYIRTFFFTTSHLSLPYPGAVAGLQDEDIIRGQAGGHLLHLRRGCLKCLSLINAAVAIFGSHMMFIYIVCGSFLVHSFAPNGAQCFHIFSHSYDNETAVHMDQRQHKHICFQKFKFVYGL